MDPCRGHRRRSLSHTWLKHHWTRNLLNSGFLSNFKLNKMIMFLNIAHPCHPVQAFPQHRGHRTSWRRASYTTKQTQCVLPFCFTVLALLLLVNLLALQWNKASNLTKPNEQGCLGLLFDTWFLSPLNVKFTSSIFKRRLFDGASPAKTDLDVEDVEFVPSLDSVDRLYFDRYMIEYPDNQLGLPSSEEPVPNLQISFAKLHDRNVSSTVLLQTSLGFQACSGACWFERSPRPKSLVPGHDHGVKPLGSLGS